jgi:glutathione S-transferase
MLIVHHLGVSQSERIVWLCEELGIPYELKKYDRDPETRLAPAAYKALHPLGTAPIITDGDLVLPESGAIVEYIINRHGGGRLGVTPDKPNYPDYLLWLHFVNGPLLPGQMTNVITAMLGVAGDSPTAGFFRERGQRALNMVEARLGVSPYLAGPDLTGADIMMVFAFTTMRNFAPADFSGHPNIRAYLKRIADRPAYQRAMAKGDPGMPLNLS